MFAGDPCPAHFLSQAGYFGVDAPQRWPQPAQPDVEGANDQLFKAQVRAHYDRLATARDRWYRRNRVYHAYLEKALRAIVPQGSSILELGCATGHLLTALQPARGVGIDLSPAMIDLARRNAPTFRFEVQDAEAVQVDAGFDFIIASDLVGELLDITAMLERIQALSMNDTRLILTFHNPALEGVLRAAQRAGLTMPPARQNWIAPRDLVNLLELSDFSLETVRSGLLLPALLPGLQGLADSVLARTPGIRYINVVTIVVARPRRPRPQVWPLSCTVVVPCRNEVGNIEAAVSRMPSMGTHTEILFVDGASTDGTCSRILEMRRRFAGIKDVKLIHQVGDGRAVAPRGVGADEPVAMLRLGKGDAVRRGFDAASGDVLMILDADLTVPPEDLPRFFNAIASGKAEFVNGSRLLYPMEERAMRLVNYLGNKFFGKVFTWLLGQPIRDTLCGTKALRRETYAKIAAGRAYFGEFDPFGDFDLLFGAARLGLKIIDVPVRYRRRRTGVTKVRVVRHGILLMAMTVLAFRKFKLARWTRA
jgi:glycosyltransferase involved in cell wall biosynthesis/ubiquinone/menaquinone biosynthesis C-methylase UbiE